MINDTPSSGMRSIGIICARGASKRLPRKNVRLLNGVPLIAYCCAAARLSRLDRVIVSTEDAEIARVCRENGVEAPFVRPDELASDYASSPDIIGHALGWLEANEGARYDVFVLLQPTTPFVLPDHIDACLDAMAEARVACCFTARGVADPPQWMFRIDDAGDAAPLLGKAITGDQEHSQHLDAAYIPNGAAYAVRPVAMRAQNRIICEPSRLVLMPTDRSVDVDDELDWLYAESVAKARSFAPVSAKQEAAP
jgi:CMP-N,N'-diacetyllegionaminic acid synthase